MKNSNSAEDDELKKVFLTLTDYLVAPDNKELNELSVIKEDDIDAAC